MDFCLVTLSPAIELFWMQNLSHVLVQNVPVGLELRRNTKWKHEIGLCLEKLKNMRSVVSCLYFFHSTINQFINNEDLTVIFWCEKE